MDVKEYTLLFILTMFDTSIFGLLFFSALFDFYNVELFIKQKYDGHKLQRVSDKKLNHQIVLLK